MFDRPIYIDLQLDMKSVSPNIHDHFDTSPYFLDPCVSGAVLLTYYYPAARKKETY